MFTPSSRRLAFDVELELLLANFLKNKFSFIKKSISLIINLTKEYAKNFTQKQIYTRSMTKTLHIRIFCLQQFLSLKRLLGLMGSCLTLEIGDILPSFSFPLTNKKILIELIYVEKNLTYME